MQQENAYKSTIKWGIILGAGLAIFELVKMFARRVEYANSQVLDIALIIGYILILFAGVKEFKTLYTERLSFSKAFLSCLIISAIGSVILFGYDMVHYAVIEPDGLNTKYEIALNNFRKVIDKDTITTEEMNTYFTTVDEIVKAQEKKFTYPDSCTEACRQEVLAGLSKITEFQKNKILEKRDLDTANNYVMANFPAYARGVLVETLISYIGQNEQKSSTDAVKQIVEKANIALAEVNPVDTRFENNKSHVPHYDKPGRYAAVTALMDLLYGMFFGLFVAMYHYTSKHPATDPNGEIPTEEIPMEETDAENNEKEIKNN